MVEDNITPFTPVEGTLSTQTLTQRLLDEAARALSRPLWNYEVRILDEILTVQAKVNRKLIKDGRANRTHSLDEVVALFVKRVLSKTAQQLTDDIMSDHTAKKERVYKELNRIANSS